MSNHSIKTTLVSCAVVFEGATALVEYTDGSLKQYVLAAIPKVMLTERCLTWLTPEQVVEKIREYNADQRMRQNAALHERKVAALGWDYVARGYR